MATDSLLQHILAMTMITVMTMEHAVTPGATVTIVFIVTCQSTMPPGQPGAQ